MPAILLLGSGLVARPIVRHLLSKNFRVTVASNTPDRALEMIAGNPNGRSVTWEATDEAALDKLVAEHDLTVSLLPYAFHVMVAKHCLAHGKNMVTTSYVKPEMKALDGEAKKKGILLLNEIGLDPGVDHMSAMRIIDQIHAKEGAVVEFWSLCGALPAPEAADNPFRYKFSWSPKGVVMAGNNDALYLRHGKKVSIPTQDLFKNPFKVEFPGAGTFEVYPNRDSLAYKEIYGIPEAQTMYRGTFRYKGWCETLDLMKELDLISYDKSDMTGMTYADLMNRQLARHASRITRHGSYAMDALRWLGLFDDQPMNRKVDSTFEVVSDLMIAKMGLKDHERDMVAMQHTFLASYPDGKKEVIRSRMLDFGTPATETSIARTVALPAAIAVGLILDKKIRTTGVHIPVIPEIYHPVLDELEKLGIKMIEEFNLPPDQNIS
ncbi:MAG TPA: saccharopine dehydrogenase C-terminal domain-containing protein [Bacteroidales bacterium]|nr:saccharopine dehydrogenase C-terminal domain-containing protein [Bacteroidales bacterium]